MGHELTVGLDVGTSKVCAVVAERNGHAVKVLGVGEAPSTGLRKGIVVHMEATVDSIKKAVMEAENSAGIRIKSVMAGISGAHIKGLNSYGAVGMRGKEVRPSDRERAVESAKAICIPLDREVLHVVATEFVLDGQGGMKDPVGMAGVRLEAKVHVITGAASPVQNLMKCCQRAGLDVCDIVFGPLASADVMLSGDEMQCGVMLVDVGGGTVDIALIKDGALRHASALGVGGSHVTSDIAIGLRTSFHEAEKLKRSHGTAYEGMVSPKEEMQICQSGGNARTLPAKYLAEIIQPRCREMIEMIRTEIEAAGGYELATCGVVFTGGGMLLKGFDKMAESMLGLPVRVGQTSNIRGHIPAGNPLCSTGVGLAVYGFNSAPVRTHQTDLLGYAAAGIKLWVSGLLANRGHGLLNKTKEGGLITCLKSKR